MFPENEHTDEKFLRGIDSKGGFTVPDNYFEALNRQILSKTTENGFTLPSSYFDTLPDRIMNRVEQKPSRMKVIYRNIRWSAVGAAAAILIVAGIVLYTSRPVKDPVAFSMSRFDELSNEDIINYMDVNDLRDGHIELAANMEDNAQKQVEEYLTNTTDEQLILEEL